MSKWIKTILFAFTLIFLLLAPNSGASAQGFTADDVIVAVNKIRTGGGLAPYQVDSWLMGYAQEHSEYQARINQSTHQHSDGLVPAQRGVMENVAAGDTGYLTVDFIISPIWADPVHMKTMVGYTSGFLGVGVASNGTTTYVTLDVRPGSSAATVVPASPISAIALTASTSTPAPFVSLITNTPQSDGSIIHIVANGETLWEIALSYGVTVADLRQLNGLSATSNAIYVGQKLIIRLPVTATATTPVTPSATATRQPSRTPRPPTPTRTQTITITPAPSPTSTKAPLISLPKLPDNKTIAYVLIGLGLAGLFVILIAGFRK